MLLAFPALGNASSADNETINRFYQHFAEAYHTLDSESLKRHYSDNALMMGVSDKEPFVDSRNDIIAAYNKWFAKVKKRDASIEIRFRCSNRVRHGDVIVDAGYYQMRYQPPAESGQVASQFGGKYLFTFAKGQDGQWTILADSANRVKQDLFNNSQAVPGLVYDPAFAPLPPKPKQPQTP